MHVDWMDHLKWIRNKKADESSFQTVKTNYDERRYKGCLAISIYSRTCISQWSIDLKCHRLSFRYEENERGEEEVEEETSYPLIMSLHIL